MVSKTSFISRDGFEKIRKELEDRKKRRKELSKAIGIAREHGDLSENADYDAAKEAQAMNEKRIAELQEKLGSSRIIEDEGISKDDVRIGAKVKLKDLESNEEIEYTLLTEVEADFSKGIISINSPVAQALLGHKKNDTVEIKLPAVTLKYKILSIL